MNGLMTKLKGGMIIKSTKPLSGVSDSYNTPERIDIPEGTILKVPSQATRMGDVFCDIVEGEVTVHKRNMYGEDPGPKKTSNCKVGLIGGYGMGGGPHILGSIVNQEWKILTEEDGN